MESIEFLFFNCIHLFLAVLGLCICRDFSLVAMHGLLPAMASVAEHGLRGVWASAVVAHRSGPQELQELQVPLQEFQVPGFRAQAQ